MSKVKYIFNREIFDEILDRMADGETLRSIFMDADMPTYSGFRAWLRGENGAASSLGVEYARARQDQADGFAQDITNIADLTDETARLAAEAALGELPATATATEKRRAYFYAKKRSVEGAKLSIDARKWTAARMNPRRWGDKISLELGMNDEKPIRIDFTNITTEQLEAMLALESQLAITETTSTHVEVVVTNE